MKRQRYRIVRPLNAVKLEDQPGSSIRRPTQTMVEIPVDAIIETEGVAQPSGLVTVLWGSDAFSVFFDDLKERADASGAAAN